MSTETRPAARPGVLLVTSHYHPVLGGVETHARELAAGFRRRHWPLVVLTTRVTDPPTRHVERVQGTPVVRTPPSTGRHGLTKWLFAPVVFLAAVRLRRHYRVMYLPDLRALAFPAIAAGWLLGRPVVLQGATPGAFSASHWDGSAARGPVRLLRPGLPLAKALMRVMLRRAAAVCCITREHADEARAAGIAADRVHYVPHGVDTTRFRPAEADERRAQRASLGWPADQVVVLFLGRLSAEKGVQDLLEAWLSMVSPGEAEPPPAHLVIVGPDMTGHPLDAGPAARAYAQAHLPGQVTFHGPTADAPAILRAADVLVQPSHYEAFPLTVLEAMASGLAVVASLVGGLRDYLVDGDNALTCPPKDATALGAALRRVVTDRELRARLAEAGPRTVAGRFDLETNTEQYAALFRRVAGPAGSSAGRG